MAPGLLLVFNCGIAHLCRTSAEWAVVRLQHCSVSPDATCHSFYDRAFGVGLFFPLRAFGVLGLRARSSCLQCHPTCNAIRRPASLGAGGSGFRVWGFALSSVQCQPLILHAMPQQGAVVFYFFMLRLENAVWLLRTTMAGTPDFECFGGCASRKTTLLQGQSSDPCLHNKPHAGSRSIFLLAF